MSRGWFLPHAPLSVSVMLRPARRSVILRSRSLSTGLIPHTVNFWWPVAKVPSGHGAQLGISRLRIQYTLTKLIGAVQPLSLVTVPVHSRGLTQLDEMVQFSMIVFSSIRTWLVLAHSPLDITRQVPLSSIPKVLACAGGATPRLPNTVIAAAATPPMTPSARIASA